jgi:hypothetical protein
LFPELSLLELKNLVSVTNIALFIGGIYFAALAGLQEATIYTVIPAILCFVAFGLGIQPDWLLSNPWRTATSALVIVLLLFEVATDIAVVSSGDYYTLASFLLNGIFLVLFIGVLLALLKKNLGQQEAKNEEEEFPARSIPKQTK